MKVYLQPPQPSRGLQRIADALQRYAPSSVEVIGDPASADLTVIYAIGRVEALTRQAQEIINRGSRYAVIQVCLRSTMKPTTPYWRPLWTSASVVWSYYDLNRMIAEDETTDEGWQHLFLPVSNFYHAPLGVDAQVFHDYDMPRHYVIATSGVSRLQESVRECVMAAKRVDRPVFHVGDNSPSWKGIARFSNGMSDEELAINYSACEFVSGLRRTEGFELPAAEGLCCGARPIVFDSPDWRFNYREFADYIREGTRAEVVDQLVQLFKQGARPVNDAELSEARHWFNWERVCGEFWQRCLG